MITASVEGATYSKKIGDDTKVMFCDGCQLLAPGTRVICSNIFERSRSLRQKQQIEFRLHHSRLVRFLGLLTLYLAFIIVTCKTGMIRLKHFGLQIDIHANAPVTHHSNIDALQLTFNSRPSALHIFAELSATKVDGCQHASLSKNGILFEIFWTFQTAKSWDLKRSSPAREMFNMFFNGALIHPSDCAVYFDQIVTCVTESLDDAYPKKRPADSENIFIQATVCITCTWDNTYKHRGIFLFELLLFQMLAILHYFARCQWLLY